MKKFSIKSKKDWFIAFAFTFLFIYLIVLSFQDGINEFLLPLTPDKVSYFNQPDQQGVLAAAVLLMTALTIGVMIYKKAGGKFLALALFGGLVTAAAIMGSYYYQCQSILKIPSECRPEAVTVSYFDERNHSFIDYALDEETKERIVAKVLALQPLPSEKAENQGMSDNGGSGGKMSVSIWYPLKNGYSYLIDVTVMDNAIRIRKGQNPHADPLYRDNGLLEILETVRNAQAKF